MRDTERERGPERGGRLDRQAEAAFGQSRDTGSQTRTCLGEHFLAWPPRSGRSPEPPEDGAGASADGATPLTVCLKVLSFQPFYKCHLLGRFS